MFTARKIRLAAVAASFVAVLAMATPASAAVATVAAPAQGAVALASSASAAMISPVRLTRPIAGLLITPMLPGQRFTWVEPNIVGEAFYLQIGTMPSTSDVASIFVIGTARSLQVAHLPRGKVLYAAVYAESCGWCHTAAVPFIIVPIL
jgi:hypothetical protein